MPLIEDHALIRHAAMTCKRFVGVAGPTEGVRDRGFLQIARRTQQPGKSVTVLEIPCGVPLETPLRRVGERTGSDPVASLEREQKAGAQHGAITAG